MTVDFARALGESGVTGLDKWGTVPATQEALRRYVASLNGAGPLDVAAARIAAEREMRAHGVRDIRAFVSAAFAERTAKMDSEPIGVTLGDPEPWPEPVEGATLLGALSDWFTAYVHLPPRAADAIALWVVATWYVEIADFAPILALLSATKRCGKTLVLDLLRGVVRRGYATSGSGVTTAVVFRLNDTQHPTFLIDEAEKLAGGHADRELVGLLNSGYRRGQKVQRCVEQNGDFVVREFDAFGFRALASIRGLWDTVTDRAVVVRLERKPAAVRVRRFARRVMEAEAVPFARQLARWTAETRERVAEALLTTPRPDWLHDRACDNWSTLFAVVAVAGGDWSARAEAAAQTLEAGGASAADPLEALVHDVARLWQAEKWTDVVASGDLVAKLNALETSSWGESGRIGKGLTPHALSALFRPHGVRPRQARSAAGDVVRGYWAVDLAPVFARYPLPEVVRAGQLVQASADAEKPVPLVPVVPIAGERQSTASVRVQACQHSAESGGLPLEPWKDDSGQLVCGVCHPDPSDPGPVPEGAL